MTSQPVELFHGTTGQAAQSMRTHGWRRLDARAVVEQVSAEHDEDPERVWSGVLAEPQCFIGTQDRDNYASFCLSFASAGHRWAQRAPEARREALWAIWRLRNPERASSWTQQVDGHAWVLQRLRDDQPAVLSIVVEYDALRACGAVMGGFSHSGLRSYEDLMAGVRWPEIAVPVPPELDLSSAAVELVPRHVEWDIYQLWLGVEFEEFEVLAAAGELGQPGTGDESLIHVGRRQKWWPLATVEAVLEARGTPWPES